MFQACYQYHSIIILPLETCAPICKAMQGHQIVGLWWSNHFHKEYAAPLILGPDFTELTIYRHGDIVTDGPTITTHQANNIMELVGNSKYCQAILGCMASKVSFKILDGNTSLFYAMDITHTALYINVYAQPYITSCLLKLGWDTIRMAPSWSSCPIPLLGVKTGTDRIQDPGA
jgi:hypothetical protein